MSLLSIVSVVKLLGLQPVRNRSSYYYCPFCGSKAFNVYPDYNSFHCFSCGEKGGIAALYGKCRDVAFTTEEERKKVFAAIFRELGDVPLSLQKAAMVEVMKPQEPLAPAPGIDHTYRALLASLSLRDTHREALRKRGLKDEDIQRLGFRSTPANLIEERNTEACVRRLLKNGFRVRGVPGFFRNEKGNWDINLYEKINGIFCPVFDLAGRICGFQIRLDEPYDNRKYIWLSSKGKTDGVSSGSPCTYLGSYEKGSEVVITEGILKATVYHALSGKNVIGQPGIVQSEDAVTLAKELEAAFVLEAYDMDRFLDVRCRKDSYDTCADGCKSCCEGICVKKARKMSHLTSQTEKLYEQLDKEKIPFASLRWDMEHGFWAGNYKGCDDAALAGIRMNTIGI